MENFEKVVKAGFKVLKASTAMPVIEEFKVEYIGSSVLSWWDKAYEFKTKKQRSGFEEDAGR